MENCATVGEASCETSVFSVDPATTGLVLEGGGMRGSSLRECWII